MLSFGFREPNKKKKLAQQGGRCTLKSPTKASQSWSPGTWLFLSFLVMIPETLLPSKKESSTPEVTLLCLASTHLPPPVCFQHLHHWELSTAADYIMTSIFLLELKNIWKWNEERREIEAQGRAPNKKTRAHACPRMTPEVVFAWKMFFRSLTHSLSLSLSPSLPSLYFLLAVWRASSALLASSQEVKLNCRAKLPNDERLWHPGMLCAWTKSSEREKMLAFQLNTFFLLHFFSRAFFGVGFSIIRANIFFFPFLSACTTALEQELLVGDGWMVGSSEEEEGKRMGRELSVGVRMFVCKLWGCRDAVWTWVCSLFLNAVPSQPQHSLPPPPHQRLNMWLKLFSFFPNLIDTSCKI